ncbi:hypothetical protein ACRCPS_17930 [Pseudomonas aeruginosa]
MLLLQYFYAAVMTSIEREPAFMAELGIVMLLGSVLFVTVADRLLSKRRS